MPWRCHPQVVDMSISASPIASGAVAFQYSRYILLIHIHAMFFCLTSLPKFRNAKLIFFLHSSYTKISLCMQSGQYKPVLPTLLPSRCEACGDWLRSREYNNGTRKVLAERSWWTPRARYDEHSSKFPLIYKTKVYRPVGERRLFWRCCRRTDGRAHYRRQQQLGTCTQTTKLLCPNYSARLSISLVLLNTKG